MTRRTLGLTEALYEYVLAHGVREPELLVRLRAETDRLGKPARMQISPEQGQLMAFLVELIGARRGLEIGTFTGYSALACALALPPHGELVVCEINDSWLEIAGRYWAEAGVASRITVRRGPALATLDAMTIEEGEAGRFDFAFIDANKDDYDGYYERCLQLVRPGGLILLDNMLWRGAVADPADQDAATVALRALNEKLYNDPRISLALVPIGDGLTLARRR